MARRKFFGDITFMSHLENRVIAGERPPLPADCPAEIAAVITSCWATNPDDRPSFEDIVARLLAIIAKLEPALATQVAAEESQNRAAGRDFNLGVDVPSSLVTDESSPYFRRASRLGSLRY